MNFDTLLTVSEISVAMLGFTAIVVMFKRRDSGTWLKVDANRFHGMMVHALIAMVFGFIPLVMLEFSDGEEAALKTASALLAIATIIQVVVTSIVERNSSLVLRLLSSIPGVGILALLALNSLGNFPASTLGIYLIGLLYHLLLAASLFTSLIWIREVDVGQDT